jgi:hypothetical protein
LRKNTNKIVLNILSMENIFIIATIISIIFFIVKFIEMRFIKKESKPLKFLIRDALLVYFSVIISNFIINQINPVVNSVQKITPVFTDNPGF